MDARTPLSPAPRHTLPPWLVAALLAFCVALSFQYADKASQGTGERTALGRWRSQVLALWQGKDIYRLYNFPNPPVMAILLTPVEVLRPLAGGLVWFFLKVGMTLLALAWVFRLVEAPGRPFPTWAKVLTALLSLRPIAGDLAHGNVNLFILFLVVGFLYALHRRRDFLGGLVLALAMACKVTPALFVPYLVWKRAPRALAGCAVGVALFFWPGLVPAAFLGWQRNLELVEGWTANMVKPFVVDGEVTSEHNNQSLPGLVYRLTTHSPSFVVYVKDEANRDVWTPVRWHNLLSLSPLTARWLVKGCMGLFVLLIVWTCRTPRAAPLTPTPLPRGERGGGEGHSSHRLAAEYSIVVLGMLLFSERTWKHHCVTLMLPFAVLSYQLALVWRQKLLRGYLIATLAAVVLLMTTTSTSLLGKEGGKLAQVYGAYVIVFFALLAALVVLLKGKDAADPAERAQDFSLAA
jgi:hypothetical protein